MARKSRSRKPRLGALSLTDVKALYHKLALKELDRLPGLKARRAELEKELANLIEEIATIEAAAAGAPARPGSARLASQKAEKKSAPAKKSAPTKKSRATRTTSSKAKSASRPKTATKRKSTSRTEGPTLREAIRQILSASTEPLSPREIRDAIVSQDLVKNRTDSFHQQVTGTLSRSSEFRRVVAGKYSL